MKKLVILLVSALISLSAFSEIGDYYKSVLKQSGSVQAKTFIPAATYSDSITLIRMFPRTCYIGTVRDVVLEYPNGDIFVGFVNIVNKSKAVELMGNIEYYQNAVAKNPSYRHEYEPVIPKNSFLSTPYATESSYSSTTHYNEPFPYEIVFGCIVDSNGNSRYVYPDGTLTSDQQTRTLLCGQWGKGEFQKPSVLNADMGYSWVTKEGGNYNWTFNNNGTGSVSFKSGYVETIPQVVANSWYGGQYNRKHYQMTGGYDVNATSTVTLSFTWTVADTLLTIHYKTFSYTPVEAKLILPKREDCATEQYFREICAQCKADFPTNQDVKKMKNTFTELLQAQKESFHPGDVPFTIIGIDKNVLIVSNSNTDVQALTRNQTLYKSLRAYNFHEVSTTQDGFLAYPKAAYSLGKWRRIKDEEARKNKLEALIYREQAEDAKFSKAFQESLLGAYYFAYSTIQLSRVTYQDTSALPLIREFRDTIKSVIEIHDKDLATHQRLKTSYNKEYPKAVKTYLKNHAEMPELPTLYKYNIKSNQPLDEYLENIRRTVIAYSKELHALRHDQLRRTKFINIRKDIIQLNVDITSNCEKTKKFKKLYSKLYDSLNLEWNEDADNVKIAKENRALLTKIKELVLTTPAKDLDKKLGKAKTIEDLKSAFNL